MPITVKTIQRINPRKPEEEGKYYLTVANQKKTELKTFCKLMVQMVFRLSGVNPAAVRLKLNFMVKHPAGAAATNSSGLVPMPSSFALRQAKF